MWYLENDDFDEFLLRAKLFKYAGHDAYWRKTVKISRVMNLSFFQFCPTLFIPTVIKTEFLFTVSIQQQEDKWWE